MTDVATDTRKFVMPPRAERKTKPRARVLDALRRRGGEITDADALAALGNMGRGRAVWALREEVRRAGEPVAEFGLAGLLHDMEEDGLIERTMSPRRTYSIRLKGVPEGSAWPIGGKPPEPEQDDTDANTELADDEPTTEPEPGRALAVVPDASPIQASPVRGVDYAVANVSALTDEDVSKVALGLLEAVSAIMSNGSLDAISDDLEAVKLRLGATLDEAQRLRAKNTELADQLRAVVDERDGLRSRLRQVEINVTNMLKNGQHDAGVSRRALERFMQARPGVPAR